ncbi:MAG: BREX system P-loop protein BrxC [Nitrospira sp.]|nr:BREX system P-loop protein BrxC [Nitrospira sp.]
MNIQNLFERDLFRPINGVVKADQLDESSVWQELDEFVVTRELDQHLRSFFSTYGDAIQHPQDPDVAGKIGVWVSGFFGSGKSHFIKVLSYLLQNKIHTYQGQSKRAVEFFERKIKDAMLFGDIKRAVASNTDVILFNIDSKADHRIGRDAILAVFLKVLNEMQGYCGDHPQIAHLERHLEGRGKLAQFHDAFRKATGSEWTADRDAYHFHRDEIVKALGETLKMSKESAEKWVDGAEGSFALTVENLCKWVKGYLDSKGEGHRLIFLVDEVGQFIGTDSHLMLNLQTITEELGTICKGRAWVVVTSQEDIDAVLGEMKQSKANDFSKIQGRFRTRLSLSSANVDEVIQSRLLAKREEVKTDLQELFLKKGDILKNQLTFTNCGMTFKNVKDGEDFVQNYPFVPYQFQLVQKIFEAIRRAGATGLHLSRGERSILDAVQSAGKQVALEEVGILVPLYRFYPSIESFLDTVVKKTIHQAKDNPSLEHPFDISLLQVLFLIRYVEEIKGNVDNLVTLCITEIDADRLALRRKIEGSLQRLEKETLINRSGDLYFFLTNEERDINREIKNVDLSSGEEAKLLGELIYNDVLKEQRKHRHAENKMDFAFNRFCDLVPVGNRLDGVLQVSVITPLNDEYELYNNAKCMLDSSPEGGSILVRLGNDETLGRELRTYLQTEKYVRHKNDGTLPESAKRILQGLSGNNQDRRARLVTLLGEMFAGADFYAAGQPLKLKASTPLAALDESLGYLVKNTFNKMGYLKRLSLEPLKEIQTIIRSNDIVQQTLSLATEEGNKQAIDDLRNYVALMSSANKQIVLQDMIDKRYSLRPYGWPEDEVVMLIARLMVLGEVSLMMDGTPVPLDKTYDAITAPAKRRKIVILKRQTTDPKAIQDARTLGKELFHEMGTDGEDALFAFLQNKLKSWQSSLMSYRPLAETGDYPGRDQIEAGLLAVKKLLASDNSYKFIQQLNEQKNELLDFADHFTHLEQFYEHQKPTWERLRKAYARFQRNRLELERDAQAGVALKRMQQILNASSPYSLIKETEGLIATVSTVNSALVAAARQQALAKIDVHLVTVTRDIEAAKGDAGLRAACMRPLEELKGAVQSEESLAHITQIETEALKEFDLATSRIEEFVRKATERPKEKGEQPKPVLKKKRVVVPAKLVASPYLETQAEVEAFLTTLRSELEQALTKDERIEIR